MKKLFISFLLLIACIFPAFSFAEGEILDIQQDAASSQAAVPIAEDDYTLPFPGLLPDNPLYFLKTARDKVIGMLISDPRKKAEFDLLQADKRVEAANLLVQKDSKKYPLAETTLSKAENYIDEAILKIQEAHKIGIDTSDIESKVSKALHKHAMILVELEKSAPKDQKSNFSSLLKRVGKLEARVNKLFPQS
jgi:hypothetical protein